MFFKKTFTSKSDSNESHIQLINTHEVELESRPESNFKRDVPFSSSGSRIRTPNSWRSRFSGWRGWLLMALIITSVTLMLNIVLVVVATLAWKPKNGIATAFTGNCRTTGRWTIGLHLLINLLSSTILGASNFTMQRLVAPTRAEVDAAHAKRKWLDIGIPSVRNLFRISKKRTVMWLLLGLSSVPLHFVYNSVVFQTIAGNQVGLVTVIPEFFQEKDNWSFARFGLNSDGNSTNGEWNYYRRYLPLVPHLQSLVLGGKYLDLNLFHNLTKQECINRYSKPFITDVGAGYVVVPSEYREQFGLNTTETLHMVDEGFGGFDLDISYISYCLAEVVEQHCRIEFSLPILSIVVACGALKVILMSVVLWLFDQEALVTVGDAIQSFLLRPDPTTEGRCLMSSHDVGKIWKETDEQHPKRWQGVTRHLWWRACSTRRWILSLLFYISAIIATSVMYRQLERTVGKSDGGFGRASIEWLYYPKLPFRDSILPLVLLANLPQAIVSFMYISYNGLFSCMLAGREWSQYAFKRAPLRVTRPGPTQRSTYFIQLPFTWGVPLIVASALLHWFISQTWFLVRVSMYQDGIQKPASETISQNFYYGHFSEIPDMDGVLTGLGYSNTALVAATSWLGALVCVCVLVAVMFRYPRGLPLGGTNSAVISASCHAKYEDGEDDGGEEGIVERPVMWGVTIQEGEVGIGHCCFSTKEVEPPIQGHLYAG